MTLDEGDFVPRYQNVTVRLCGEDGNVFAVIGRVGRALKRAGYRPAADRFYREAQRCMSYTDVLDLVQRTVTTDED